MLTALRAVLGLAKRDLGMEFALCCGTLAYAALRPTSCSCKALFAIARSGERKRTWDETPDSCCKMGIKKARIISAWVNVEMGWNYRTTQLRNTFLMSSREEDERHAVRRVCSINGGSNGR